jgi:hypothetical protein
MCTVINSRTCSPGPGLARTWKCPAIWAGPTFQDAKTPSYYGLNPFCYIVNAGGGTRGDSEFRRPEMWALAKDKCWYAVGQFPVWGQNFTLRWKVVSPYRFSSMKSIPKCTKRRNLHFLNFNIENENLKV